jgi:hypothetical protein
MNEGAYLEFLSEFFEAEKSFLAKIQYEHQ